MCILTRRSSESSEVALVAVNVQGVLTENFGLQM